MDLDLIGVFAGGLLTFLSPCILPLVPVYLGLLGGDGAGGPSGLPRPGRTVPAALAFSLGLGLVFVLLGLAATAFGRALVAHRTLLLQVGGLAVFLFGLKLLGYLHIPALEQERRPLLGRVRGGGLVRAFVLGAAFALGWTPCVGPVLGSVLTYAASAAVTPARGALYLGLFAAGLSLPLVGAAAVAPLALRWIKGVQAHLQTLQKATGALLAIVGLLLVTDKLALLVPESAPPAAVVAASEPPPSTNAAVASPEPAACTTQGPASSCDLGEGPVTSAREAALPKGPAVLEFVSRSCPICLRMAPVVAAAERSCAGQGVTVERIEVDTPEGLALARRFGVLGVPTFVFVDAGQRQVARLVGEQRLEALEQTVQVLTGQQCSRFRALSPK